MENAGKERVEMYNSSIISEHAQEREVAENVNLRGKGNKKSTFLNSADSEKRSIDFGIDNAQNSRSNTSII